jgi:membrane protein DedA with SNARE-associated domain
VLAFIPNPVFDLAGMIAGALKMKPAKFLFYCAVGKILKMMVFAYTGASLFNLFQ